MTGCVVINLNEDSVIELIEQLYYKNKEYVKIIVVGCILTIVSKRIYDISENILQIHNKNIDKLDVFFC